MTSLALTAENVEQASLLLLNCNSTLLDENRNANSFDHNQNLLRDSYCLAFRTICVTNLELTKCGYVANALRMDKRSHSKWRMDQRQRY